MKTQDELKPYKQFGLTMLQFMGLLAVMGIVGAVIVHYFF